MKIYFITRKCNSLTDENRTIFFRTKNEMHHYFRECLSMDYKLAQTADFQEINKSLNYNEAIKLGFYYFTDNEADWEITKNEFDTTRFDTEKVVYY